ncbi:MAG: EamA family transporter, partial [Saprospiraceae bacterium]|nr:EamA family transporter [Saprospiraceae bacterium]
KQSLIFLIVSGITTGLSWLFYFKAIQVGQVSQVAVVDKLSVALTVLIALIFLGESLSIKSAIGITLIISGTVLMIFK